MSQRSRNAGISPTRSIESIHTFPVNPGAIPFNPTRSLYSIARRPQQPGSSRTFTPRVVRTSGSTDKPYVGRRQSNARPGSSSSARTRAASAAAAVAAAESSPLEPQRIPRAAYLDQSAFRALLVPDDGVDHLTSLPKETPTPSLISPNPQWSPDLATSTTSGVGAWVTQSGGAEGPWGASTLTAVTRGITSNFNSGIQPPSRRTSALTTTRPLQRTHVSDSEDEEEEEDQDDRATPVYEGGTTPGIVIPVDSSGQNYVRAAAYAARVEDPVREEERREYDRVRRLARQVSNMRAGIYGNTSATSDDDMPSQEDDRLLASFAEDDELDDEEPSAMVYLAMADRGTPEQQAAFHAANRERRRRRTARAAAPAPAQPTPIPQFLTLTFQLPTRWSEHLNQQSLSVSEDGRKLSFHGTAPTSERNAAAARTSSPIHAACGIFYYEVEILTCGQKPQISIGLATRDVRMNRLPGWESNSWGYHADDGCSFHAERGGKPYGPTFNARDIIGCGIDFTTNRCFYTKNGAFLGLVFDSVGVDKPVYPAVGLRHPNESIRANFGQEPFRFPIDDYATERRAETWQGMAREPLSSAWLLNKPGEERDATEDEVQDVMKGMVLEYLAHHGYTKTANALRPKEKAEEATMDADAVRNWIVRDLGVRGDVDSAIKLTKEHFPEVLNGELMRKLELRKFVEMVLDAAALKKGGARNGAPPTDGMAVDGDMMDVDSPPPTTMNGGVSAYEVSMNKAIAYGKTLNTAAAATKDPGVQATFTRTFGIVAFEDPTAVPELADIAGKDARIALAHELNQAILKSQGRPGLPLLEGAYRQASACTMQLGLMGVGAAAYMDIRKELLSADV